TRLGITVGSMLLPPLNDFMATVGPIISSVTSLAGAHPWLIKGLLGAAVGFTVLRLAAAGAAAKLTLVNAVASMSPVGMIVRGIAIAAGILIGNWSTVAPYFQAVWDKIKAPAMAVWEWMKAAFAWSPLGMIVANWEPLTQFFGALWELVKALSVPFFGFLKTLFDWSPLGLIIKHWEPITGFFKGLWDKLRPIIEPMMKFLGFDAESSGDGVISAATAKVNNWTEQQKARNAAGEPVPGALVKPMAQPVPGELVKPMAQPVQLMPEATSVASLTRAPSQPGPWAAMPLSASQAAEHAQESLAKGLTPGEALKRAQTGLPGQTSLAAPAPGALAASRGSLVQQAGPGSKTQLEGQMVVRFDNAPPGMRVEQADTNQPGLQVSPQVGYRSLGRPS
ncbi:phage tail tape measure protein, partial [Pseudomonas sp. NMI795_08]|nr:phage tail tape measure protein [Pseudomonas sp. NMI795_08]